MNEKMCKLLKIAQDIWTVLQSLPSRERGLKFNILFNNILESQSLPSRERGLKSDNGKSLEERRQVAPLAGAWIEIFHKAHDLENYIVAPLAGAWIEIAFIISVSLFV